MATQEEDDDFEQATKLTDTSQVDSFPLGM